MKATTQYISALGFGKLQHKAKPEPFVFVPKGRFSNYDQEDQVPSDCQKALYLAAQIKVLRCVDHIRELKADMADIGDIK